MSFGKDSKHLDTMPVYGGSYTQRAANAGRKRERDYGNKRPYWVDTFKPSETQDSSIRLIPGEYEVTRTDDKNNLYVEKINHFEFIEHYSGRTRAGGICSGGPLFFRKDLRDVCLGCDQRDAEGKVGKNQRPVMSRSEKFAFTMVDQGNFHQVPQTDRKTGQIRYKQDGQPYTEWVKCSSRGCQNCHLAIQNRYGYIQPWVMPKAHFNTLNSYAAGIAACCTVCGGRGTIQSLAWLCSNAQCKSLIFDMNTATATDEQIAEVVNQPFHCRTCRQVGYPEEVYQCQNCLPAGRQPVRATIFDVDLLVRVLKTGQGEATVLQVTGVSDPRPLHPAFTDLLQYKPDLAKRFTPTPVEKQAELWGVNRAQGPVQGQPPPGQPGAYGQAPGGYQPPQQYAQPYGQAPMQSPLPVQHPVPPGAQWTPQSTQPGYVPPPQQPPQQPQAGYSLQPPAGPPVGNTSY